MSTITREFTKEQLQQIIETDHVQCGEASSLARVALASLEAEPRGYIDAGTPDDGVSILTENKLLKTDIALYTAPPAPANSEPVAWLWSHRKHPSEVTLVRPEDDERAEGAHWSGWNCQALYAAPPAPASVPDEDLLHMAASAIEDLLSNKDRYCAGVWADIPAKLRRAAMLQGADGNSPVIPDGWVACSERMPDDDDFVYIWPRPDFGVELHVGQYCECHPKGDGWYAQVYEQNYGIEWCPITVTHWMPLPAAPQQEVTQALAKGMERYGDAMQKLADSGD
ncbi:DUF551 domain-containing protein [Enterobacter roggenkampii]|uniref:DUF551 domain-containing protein n=1 Tax=Enterobacter roggenkampii TaxID=1812935 RepID=UPI003BC4D61C